MKTTLRSSAVLKSIGCNRQTAEVPVLMLVLILLVLGLGGGALWLYRSAQPVTTVGSSTQTPAGLSDASKSILQHLDAPVEIRFFSLLDPAAAPEALRAFSGRVDDLLSEYQRDGGGKVTFTKSIAEPAVSGSAAFAAGIQPFNLDKGDGCYLGLTVECNGRRETMPRLMPEWESALESDVSRAIAKVAAPPPPTNTTANPLAANPAVLEEVKRALPNFATVSVKEGDQLLRDAALKEFTAVVRETQVALQTAQQRLADAQAGGSDAAQQEAMKNLQQLQAVQTEKLKEISARSRLQIEAFEKWRAANH